MNEFLFTGHLAYFLFINQLGMMKEHMKDEKNYENYGRDGRKHQ